MAAFGRTEEDDWIQYIEPFEHYLAANNIDDDDEKKKYYYLSAVRRHID